MDLYPLAHSSVAAEGCAREADPSHASTKDVFLLENRREETISLACYPPSFVHHISCIVDFVIALWEAVEDVVSPGFEPSYGMLTRDIQSQVFTLDGGDTKVRAQACSEGHTTKSHVCSTLKLVCGIKM